MKLIIIMGLYILSSEGFANDLYCDFTEGGEYKNGQRVSRHFKPKALKGLNSLIVEEDELRSELNIQSLDDFSLDIYARDNCETFLQRTGYKCFSDNATTTSTPLYFFLKDNIVKVAMSFYSPWYLYTEDTYSCQN